jgi:hypothetical protein
MLREGYKICEMCGDEKYIEHGRLCRTCEGASKMLNPDVLYIIESLVNRIKKLESKINH